MIILALFLKLMFSMIQYILLDRIQGICKKNLKLPFQILRSTQKGDLPQVKKHCSNQYDKVANNVHCLLGQ